MPLFTQRTRITLFPLTVNPPHLVLPTACIRMPTVWRTPLPCGFCCLFFTVTMQPFTVTPGYVNCYSRFRPFTALRGLPRRAFTATGWRGFTPVPFLTFAGCQHVVPGWLLPCCCWIVITGPTTITTGFADSFSVGYGLHPAVTPPTTGKHCPDVCDPDTLVLSISTRIHSVRACACGQLGRFRRLTPIL